ncbi:MAG: GerMN domain-containing protein [Syntrophobacterales bacterium]
MRSWRTTKRKRRLWLLLSAAIALGFAAAFFLGKHFFSAPESTTPHSKIRDSVPVQAASTRKVHLYFASRKGRFLQAEERKIQASDTGSAIEAIISALLEGPEDVKLVSAIPAGSKLLHTFITDDGTAYVDFNPELSLLHPGGVTAERLTVYAIVNSIVLNFDSVERVQLLLEGKPAATLAGHLDIRLARTANLLIVR